MCRAGFRFLGPERELRRDRIQGLLRHAERHLYRGGRCGGNTSCAISDLVIGTKYYFAATAYNGAVMRAATRRKWPIRSERLVDPCLGRRSRRRRRGRRLLHRNCGLRFLPRSPRGRAQVLQGQFPPHEPTREGLRLLVLHNLAPLCRRHTAEQSSQDNRAHRPVSRRGIRLSVSRCRSRARSTHGRCFCCRSVGRKAALHVPHCYGEAFLAMGETGRSVPPRRRPNP